MQGLRIKNIHDLHNSPLWHNSALAIQRKDCAEKGYTLVKDILNAEGLIYTLNELHEMNLNINFLEYETLKFDYQRMRYTLHETNKTFGPDIPLIR